MSETIEETLIRHMEHIGKLTKQRDNLLAACKKAKKDIYAAVNGNKKILSHTWQDLEVAIAEAKGD